MARPTKRREHDAYYSPAWAAGELLKYVPEIRGERIIEPCVGEGALATPLRAAGCSVITNDLVPSIEAGHHLDAAHRRSWEAFPEMDYAISNPPFVKAQEILELAMEYALVGAAFFLRLTFLEPTDSRSLLLARNPPSDLIICPRFSFTQNGKTDSVTCAWMVWYRRRRPQRIIIVPKVPALERASALFNREEISL